MMAVLAIAFCWAHKTGEGKDRAVKPLKVKKHGRLEKNLFRYGLYYLTDKLIGTLPSGREVLQLLYLFLCPPQWVGKSSNNIRIKVYEVYL